MLVDPHGHVEGLLNVLHAPLDLHVHAIARGADHREAVGLRKTNHGVIILLAGTKPLCKLGHREELPVRGTGRIVEVVKE